VIQRRLAGSACALVIATSAIAAPALGAPTTPSASGPTTTAPVKAKFYSKADLRRAQRQLERAKQRLSDLQQQQRAARRDANESEATLGNLAREQYASGSPDLAELALLIGSDDPQQAMRDAALVSDFGADRKADLVAAEQRLSEAQSQSDDAATATKKAQRNLLAAFRAVLSTQSAGSHSGGPGSAKLDQRCQSAKSASPICIYPSWTERNQTLDSVIAGRYVNIRWPQIKDVGGWRPYDAYPDHPSGRAIDIMMPNRGVGSDVKLGNEIAAYFQKHAADYGIYYMIWRQQMWKSSSPPGAWTGLRNRGSATANHFDHIHISFTDGHSAKILPELLKLTELPD
jgi:type II secretory pathway pseudopilin PulG